MTTHWAVHTFYSSLSSAFSLTLSHFVSVGSVSLQTSILPGNVLSTWVSSFFRNPARCLFCSSRICDALHWTKPLWSSFVNEEKLTGRLLMLFIAPGSWQGRTAYGWTGTECVPRLQPAVRQPVHRRTWHTSGTVLHRDTEQELPRSHVSTET